MKVWSEIKQGRDGREYSLRYMLTPEEVFHLQKIGLIGEVSEIVGMQTVCDTLIAQFEVENILAEGGQVQ